MFGAEIEVLKYLQSIRTDVLNTIFEYITILGEETPMVLIIAILYFAYDKCFAQKLFFVTIGSLGFNGIIKNIVKLPRPFASGKVTCVRPETATGYSFPSGHTQNFATWSSVINMKLKEWWLAVITGIMLFLVAFSRVFIGAHFPSDVIFGAIFGILFSVIGCALYDKFENKRKLYLMTAIVFTPFALMFLINADLLYKDFYKVYGMIIGLFLAVMVEEKYAPLQYNISYWKKILRIVIAIIFAYFIKEGIKILDTFNVVQLSLIFNSIGYMLLVFAVFGICPVLFKKCKI